MPVNKINLQLNLKKENSNSHHSNQLLKWGPELDFQ